MARENPNTFFRAAGQLKSIKRSGWVKKAHILNAESVADHSFRMAVMGAVLGEERNLDAGKVVRMCLVHDIAESKIGDLMPEEKTSEKEHRALEQRVGRRLLSALPSKSKKRLSADWTELFENKSKEARLVWEIDKLEMGLQMKDYSRSGIDLKSLTPFDPADLLPKEMKKILDSY
jgi:putative hydrolases of HD superfamily